MASHLPVRGEYTCKALGARCKKCIGCCINVRTTFLTIRTSYPCTSQWTGIPAEGTLFPFEMSMVSRGLVSYPKDCITEEMSIPILPTTKHPRGQKPLVTDPSLPWDDCYHCTVAAIIVRVLYRERDIRERGKYALMPRQQTAIYDFQQIDDNKWREKLLDMEESGGTDFEPDPIEDQEGIEEFYESLKTELDVSQRPVHNEEIPKNDEHAQLAHPEATNELIDLNSLECSDGTYPFLQYQLLTYSMNQKDTLRTAMKRNQCHIALRTTWVRLAARENGPPIRLLTGNICHAGSGNGAS